MNTKYLNYLLLCLLIFLGACGKDTKDTKNTNEKAQQELPINITVFLDLSDRIEKEKDNMIQSKKDSAIVNNLISLFINNHDKKFNKSQDSFQVIFYPAPSNADDIANKLSLDLGKIEGAKKRSSLLDFKKNHTAHIKELYDKALQAKDYFGSDIWGFFKKDKVADYIKDSYRNVFILLTDGYIYDKNNVKVEDGYYSYILPKNINTEKGLIPCKISKTDFELYIIECNPTPAEDLEKMRELLNSWFSNMGIKSIDIKDTDLPSNTIKHLNNKIFD